MSIGTILQPAINTPSSPVVLMKADEFIQLYENDRVELINGIVEGLPMPWHLHGFIVFAIAFELGKYIRENDLGRIAVNDSWMRTTTDPDTVRGPDVSYVSYTRQPRGAVLARFLDENPELVVEVRSPSDSWAKLLAKATEYMNANVQVVILVDPETQAITVCRTHVAPVTFAASDRLEIPDLFPGFSCSVSAIFE